MYEPSTSHSPSFVQVAVAVGLPLENHAPGSQVYDNGLEPKVVGTSPSNSGIAPIKVGGVPQSRAVNITMSSALNRTSGAIN